LGTHRYVVKFAFDGQLFAGYARQPGGGTVEDELIGALVRARLIDGPHEGAFASAGRVDKGVSALGAAAAFDTTADPDRVLRSLNAKTGSLTVHSIAEAPPGFDPRRQATSRWYRYHFQHPGPGAPVDLETMRQAAETFLGERDFSAFARLEGRNPIRRVLEVAVGEMGDAPYMDVVGESFLWNQVRRMASAVLMAGTEECSREDIVSALEGGPGGPFPPLPAHGLFLMDVVYEGLGFRPAAGFPKGAWERRDEARHHAAARLLFHDYLDRRLHDVQAVVPAPGPD